MLNQSELYWKIATKLANYLKKNQILQTDVDFTLSSSVVLSLSLFSDTSLISLKIARGNSQREFILKAKNKIKVHENQFFKISPDGRLYTIEGFWGLPPTHKPQNKIEKNKNLLKSNTEEEHKASQVFLIAKKAIKKVPFLFDGLRRLKEKVFPEPVTDLSAFEGACFRVKSKVGSDGFLLESYDCGGIYDRHLNAEGLNYPNQVAGNYYADAYSVLLFLRLFEKTKSQDWYEQALLSWKFLKRIYPQYMPSKIVWHHSDFKNAGLLEVIAQFGKKYPEFSTFNKELVEDCYEPTNVFALRCHWKSLAEHLGRSEESIGLLEQDYLKLYEDQTLDGLFHDNIAAYPDAHDLTYHQYSCACVAQALHYKSDDSKRELFLKAVRFTLQVLGPEGEPSYVGRASNNLHHSASAILAFHKAASLTPDIDEKAQFLKAATVCAARLPCFQQDSGMIPTGLNSELDLRMAWNHCETPYNALAGYFLLRALEFQEQGVVPTETLLPLEKEQVWLANDAGYATLSNSKCYLVVFSGCDKSYTWSEGKHITGAAGVALFGLNGNPSVFPCLDLHCDTNTFVSDLPVINGQLPFGRGEFVTNSGQNIITLKHQYGNATLIRTYEINHNKLTVTTEINSEDSITLIGKLRLPILLGEKRQQLAFKDMQAKVYSRNEPLTITLKDGFEGELKIEKVDAISNAKGFTSVFFSSEERQKTRNISYSYEIIL